MVDGNGHRNSFLYAPRKSISVVLFPIYFKHSVPEFLLCYTPLDNVNLVGENLRLRVDYSKQNRLASQCSGKEESIKFTIEGLQNVSSRQ